MPNQTIDELICEFACKCLPCLSKCPSFPKFKLALYEVLKKEVPKKKKVEGEPCPCGDIDCRISDEENNGYNQAIDDLDTSLKRGMGI